MDDFQKLLSDLKRDLGRENAPAYEMGVRAIEAQMIMDATERVVGTLRDAKTRLLDTLQPQLPPPQPQFNPPPNGYTGQLNGHQSQQFAPHSSYYEEEEGFPNVVSRGYRTPQ